ncbi:hypothetical protein P0136_10535 [Lentisphaerota bacterium ZTH]|nr:hypothetical protein JYG24_11955 [Lentisphaerota bacterium]WET05797.1 hypothetical protein P0136_10535 [Lentisphaerota bacterium ZTH]
MRCLHKIMILNRGQATVELCIGLVAVLTVFLGIVVIAGLSISNIRLLVNAKTYAEYGAHSVALAPGAGTDIYSWDYGQTNAGGDGLPFTVDDRSINYPGSAEATDYFRRQFNSQENSESSSAAPPDEQYQFSPISGLGDYAQHNFAKNFPEMFTSAAGLISSTASSGIETVFTLNRDEFTSDELRTISRTFYALFGTNIETIDLRNNQSNIVYMPASR